MQESIAMATCSAYMYTRTSDDVKTAGFISDELHKIMALKPIWEDTGFIQYVNAMIAQGQLTSDYKRKDIVSGALNHLRASGFEVWDLTAQPINVE